MTEPALDTPSDTPTRPLLSALVTALLLTASLLYSGYHLRIAFESEDTHHLETPLAMAVARQLREGPSTLYGPFSGERPEVLIHAPLYYRMSGLLAWVIHQTGAGPVGASLAAGRIISVLGWLMTLGAVWTLGRAGGMPPVAGLWSALLVASSPVVGSLPETVRADMLAIGLQTWGFSRIVRAESEGASARRLLLAFLAFALAVCVKQHSVALFGVASLWLAASVVRGQTPIFRAVLAGGLCSAVILLYYGMEDVLTAGRMHEAAILLPSRLRSLSPGGWPHVEEVVIETAKLAVGLAVLGTALLLSAPRKIWGNRLDALIWLGLGAELALAVVLCSGSTGAWVNYFAPSAVLASALLGRGLARALRSPGGLMPRLLVVLALLGLWVRDLDLVRDSALIRQDGRNTVRIVLDDSSLAGMDRTEIYFVGFPDRNRLYGNRKLAHDEWLYGQFEALNAAEPRSAWLRPALEHGPVRAVVVAADGRRAPDHVDGLTATLPQLGYDLARQIAGTCVWVRPAAGRAPTDSGSGGEKGDWLRVFEVPVPFFAGAGADLADTPTESLGETAAGPLSRPDGHHRAGR